MLANSAIAQLALASFPGGGGDTGLAWRRWWIQDDYKHMLNRDAPHHLVWADDEEAIALLLQ